MFEPKPGVVCNVNEMFRCYAENYLSDYPEFVWGGYIVMNVFDMKYNDGATGEPLYQFVASDVTDALLKQIKEKSNEIEKLIKEQQQNSVGAGTNNLLISERKSAVNNLEKNNDVTNS